MHLISEKDCCIEWIQQSDLLCGLWDGDFYRF